MLLVYIPVNNFQSCRDDFLSSWVDPVLKQWIKCLTQGHNTPTSNPSITSLMLYQLSHCTPPHYLIMLHVLLPHCSVIFFMSHDTPLTQFSNYGMSLFPCRRQFPCRRHELTLGDDNNSTLAILKHFT